jgi:hypothetical protein
MSLRPLLLLWIVLTGSALILFVLIGLRICTGFQRWRFQHTRDNIHRYLTKHPKAGILKSDGTYIYKRCGLTVRYAYQPVATAEQQMIWISVKRRLPWVERTYNMLMGKIRAFTSRGAERYLR